MKDAAGDRAEREHRPLGVAATVGPGYCEALQELARVTQSSGQSLVLSGACQALRNCGVGLGARGLLGWWIPLLS